MTMDDFQIDGIRQDVTESLKSAVRYSIPLHPRCFRWKIVVVVCHDQVRLQVSQGFRCRDS